MQYGAKSVRLNTINNKKRYNIALNMRGLVL